MRKLLFITIIFFFLVSTADAQNKKKKGYRYELIGSLGASNFLGDLGGADQIGTNGLKDLELVLTRPAVAIGIRYTIDKYFSVKNNLYWGIVRGDDKLTKEEFRNNRNIHFKSPVVELSSQVEFNFLKEQRGHIYRIKTVRGTAHKNWQIYLFGGGGAVYFNPKAQYNGSWYALKPLETEGVSYKRITGLVSVGGGMRLGINNYWGVGFELGMRKTWSDYMDDVSSTYVDPSIFNGDKIAEHFSNPMEPSNPLYCYPCTGEQRGDRTDKDAYMFGVATVGYKMMKKKRSRSKF